ncbi:unnamed protein product [Euphydryas editha]|uniref:Uncharacterized protein n=1 Tax=Euphydryas editha TaxID=104508 RepID=A0AAU9UNL6_EUPED|nr:unnamed protein product [Euphydryas editha]
MSYRLKLKRSTFESNRLPSLKTELDDDKQELISTSLGNIILMYTRQLRPTLRELCNKGKGRIYGIPFHYSNLLSRHSVKTTRIEPAPIGYQGRMLYRAVCTCLQWRNVYTGNTG